MIIYIYNCCKWSYFRQNNVKIAGFPDKRRFSPAENRQESLKIVISTIVIVLYIQMYFMVAAARQVRRHEAERVGGEEARRRAPAHARGGDGRLPPPQGSGIDSTKLPFRPKAFPMNFNPKILG
jgi:hypothetical protein